MKRITFLFIFWIFFILTNIYLSPLCAQVNTEWIARYNGSGNNYDVATSMAIDVSGNIYITGNSATNSTNDDYLTIKYNSSGVQQWIALYNGPGDSTDNASSIVLDASGNVYVTGYSFGNGTNYDCATIKYNSSGVQQWVQRYNGPGNSFDWASAISVDDSSNVYITGYGYGNSGSQDYTTIKYNSSGIQVWVARYNGPLNYNDWAYSIAVDKTGNVYVTGEGNTDCTTIKYNSAGVQQWIASYNGPANAFDWGEKVVTDIAGNVYVAGGIQSGGTNYDYLAIKYNSSGVQQWVSIYNGGSYDQPSSMVIDPQGNMYITGRSMGNGTDYDYATVKINSSGVQQWAQRYNGAGNKIDMANSIALDQAGNVYVTGYSDETGTFNYDFATIKYNSNGSQKWIQKYNGPGNAFDRGNSIAINNNGSILVTGYSTGTGTNYDCTTIKYSQLTGLQNTNSEIPEKFSLSQNYPNPFNPNTVIRFQVSSAGFVKFVIYDVLGRDVATLVNEQLSAGTYNAEWDASNYPSGVYYYKLTAGDYTETKKMVLIK